MLPTLYKKAIHVQLSLEHIHMYKSFTDMNEGLGSHYKATASYSYCLFPIAGLMSPVAQYYTQLLIGFPLPSQSQNFLSGFPLLSQNLKKW